MTVISSYEAQFKAEGVQEVKSGFAEIAKAAALADRQQKVNTQNLKDYAKSQIQTEKEKARAIQMAQKEQAKAAAASDAMWKKISAGALVAGAAIVKFGLDSFKAYQDYAGEVRDVALASGSTATEASKLIQVLDDFEISAADVMTATKAMTKNGLEPSMESLMKLADQYNAIQDPMKKNEFLLTNLGKAGLKYANALSQGSDALRASTESINENLILTDDQIKKAEMARLAVDAWADAWEGFKVSIGGAIGELIAANSTISSQAEEYEKLTGTTLNFSRAQGEATKNFEAFQAQMKRGVATTEFYKAQMEDAGMETEDFEEKQKALEASSRQYMSVLNQISSETSNFTEKNQDLNDKLAELEAQLSKERKGSDAYKDLQSEIDDTKTSIAELAEEHAQASQKMMFDLIAQQAAAEGFKNISVEALATIGEEWGVLAEGSGEATTRMISQAEAWSEALSGVPGEIKSIAQMWSDLDKLAKKGIVLTASVVSQATGGAYGGQNTQTQCFTGDTLVSMADGSCIAIRDIRIGDRVTSHDTSTGQNIVTTVTEIFDHPVSEGGRLLLINGYLKVTPEHLLWNGRTWQPAGEFAPGDVLVNLDGSHMRVKSVREIVKNEPVYNIHVDHEAHNYYAGGVLVHNAKSNDVTTQWSGGKVGNYATGGAGGGWGIVGDRQGGGWVDGVSELVYGNFQVYPSRQAKAMLKSGMLGKVKGFAFGGMSEDAGGSTVGNIPKYNPPAPVIAGKNKTSASGGGGVTVSMPSQQAVVQAAAEMQVQTQSIANQAQVQIQTMAAQLAASQAQAQSTFEEMISVLRNENPKNVGKEVAYQLAKSS